MIVNYFELAADFTLEPADALAFFRDKGLAPTFSYLDLVGEEHNAAFTVAKMMDTDLLATVRGKLDDALASGKTLQDFKRELIPTLQSAGWWGKKDMVDPLTGRVVDAQLGSASRLETIFRTNLQSAYAAGHWEKIREQGTAAPYLLYDAVDDHRTRADHAALDGTVLPVGSAFWDTHYPPNGYNCRCGVIQLDEDELAEYGLTVSPEPKPEMRNWTNPRTGKNYVIPAGTDPQFSQNPGKWRLAKIDALAAEKAAQLAQKEATALAAAQGAIEKARTASRIEAQAAKALKDLQKAETEGAFLKQKAKVQQRAAQYQIDDAIANKTPYLAAQIKKVASTKAGKTMTPVELLEKAKEQGLKEKQAKALAGYKKAMLAGKEPNQDGLTAYGQLSPNEQAMLSQQIDVESGNYAAQLQIDEINKATGGFVYAKKAIKKLDKDKALDGLDAKQQLALINQEAEAFKTAEAQSKALKGFKKNMVAGKTPTENQLSAYKSLNMFKQQDLSDEIDLEIKKTKPAPAPVDPVPDKPAAPKPGASDAPDMDNLTKTGEKKGSNPGAFYLDNTTGQEWYIKNPNSLDNANNEVLTGKLYQLAGVESPDLALVDYQGKPGVASKIIEGLNKEPASLKAGTVSNVGEHFAIDAWLANWDVVGLKYDNLLVKGNRAIRVDTGGGLRYRAQGMLKGGAFGDTVGELDTLRDAGLNPQAASVFQYVTEEQIRSGAARVARITNAQIDDLVKLYGPADAAENLSLARTLKARRDDLATRYGVTVEELKPKKAPAIPKATVTKGELGEIKMSRVNGYTVQTDGDQIRDHAVRIGHFKDSAGKPFTRVTLDLREEALASVRGKVGGAAATIDLTKLNDLLARTLQGLGARHRDGKPFDSTILERMGDASKELTATLANIKAKQKKFASPAAVNYTINELEQVQQELNRLSSAASDGANVPPLSRFFDTETFVDSIDLKPDGKALLQTFKSDTVPLANFDRSNATLSGAQTHVPGGEGYKGTINGATVKIYAPDRDDYRYNYGHTMIDVPGDSAESVSTALKALEDLGVDMTRTTAAQREDLFVKQIGYARFLHVDQKNWQAFQAATTNQARIDIINKDAGFDITKTATWAEDKRQFAEGFGHGQPHFLRPDLDEKAVDAFAKSHVLYHNLNGLGKSGINGAGTAQQLKIILDGGGTLIPLKERIRRGIAATSQSSSKDYREGGAEAVFTRIKERGNSSQGWTDNDTGIYLNPKRLITRADRISYRKDEFGSRTAEDMRNREAGLAKLPQFSKSSSDETFFRDGVSLFTGDLEKIVVHSQAERLELIEWAKERGYAIWPDGTGRTIEEIIKAKK